MGLGWEPSLPLWHMGTQQEGGCMQIWKRVLTHLLGWCPMEDLEPQTCEHPCLRPELLVQPMVPRDSSPSPLDTIPCHLTPLSLPWTVTLCVCTGLQPPDWKEENYLLSPSLIFGLSPHSCLHWWLKPSRTACTHGLLPLSFSFSGTRCNGASRKQVLSRLPEMPALPRRSPSWPCPIPPRQQLVALPPLQTLSTLTLGTPGSHDPPMPPKQQWPQGTTTRLSSST